MTRIEKAPNLSSNIRKVEKTPSMLALDHFDEFYKKIFGQEWPSIRLALLSKSKFCALVSNFTDKVHIKFCTILSSGFQTPPWDIEELVTEVSARVELLPIIYRFTGKLFLPFYR
jgi:hypothetical protein